MQVNCESSRVMTRVVFDGNDEHTQSNVGGRVR